MLTDNCGSVHREPMLSARTMANLRASDMAQRRKPLKSPPSRKTTREEYWFPISPTARSVSGATRLKKSQRLRCYPVQCPRSSPWQKEPTADFGWAALEQVCFTLPEDELPTWTRG